MDEMLIQFGGAVKALGDGKIGGYLVPFGSPKEYDLDEEYFDADTDYDFEFPGKISAYYDHGMDATLGKNRLTRAKASMQDAGVWLEDQLNLSDAYQAKIYQLAEAGRLGLSSGSVAHLVERMKVGNVHKITKWPLAEASYTVRPANPRTIGVRPLKSWAEERVGFEDVVKEEEAAAHKMALMQAAIAPIHAETLEAAKSADEDLAQKSQSEEMESVSLTEQFAAVVSANAKFADRLEARHEARVKVGREFSQANVETLRSLKESIDGLWAKIQPPDEPEPAAEPIDGLAAEFELQELMASLDGALCLF